jgi:DNA polymerase V
VKVEHVVAYAPDAAGQRLVAAGVGRVPAGFPSPAQDYSDTQIDLTKILIRDELATFIVQVSGDSMEGAGIFDGDKLIVDRSIEPRDGHVVVAVVDGEMTVKRLKVTDSGVILQADNAQYPDVKVPELSDLLIWGVATTCLHPLD